MSGDHDKYHGTAEVVKDGGVYLSREEVQAIEQAVYLLDKVDEEMQKKAVVYRVFTALEMLKGVKPKRSHEEFLQDLDDWARSDKREWVGLTEDEVIDLLPIGEWPIEATLEFASAIEAKLKEKNA